MNKDVNSTAENDELLTVTDLKIGSTTDGREIVHGVSFTLRRGRVVGIVGESGSGKTLTCRAILGILPQLFEISGGSVQILGNDTQTLTSKQWNQLRGASITGIFQDPGSYLNPSIRIGKQIAEVLRVRRSVSRRAAKETAIELLGAVRLRRPELVYNQYPHELSGGMLQRVLVAAAVALDPEILIADEVTTALDVTVQAEILDLLLDLKEQRGLSLIVISHDLAVISQLCDEVLVMRDGEVVEHGHTDAVLFSPQHEYTRHLIAEHERYGLDRILNTLAAQPLSGINGRILLGEYDSRAVS